MMKNKLWITYYLYVIDKSAYTSIWIFVSILNRNHLLTHVCNRLIWLGAFIKSFCIEMAVLHFLRPKNSNHDSI